MVFTSIAWVVSVAFAVRLTDRFLLCFLQLAAQFLLQGTSSPQAAWLLIGIGIRLAQEVGAHRKRSLQGAVLDKDLLKVEELWKRACWYVVTIIFKFGCPIYSFFFQF
jgi:hypothetical protein